jgi:NTP pyrophosphatase (non-canonical NTP hydrolase)
MKYNCNACGAYIEAGGGHTCYEPIRDPLPPVVNDAFGRNKPTGLTFDRLRAANTARLPLFKNKHGDPAHSEPDGSDWSPAQWLQAVVGELGEYANLRKKYERGDIGLEEFLQEAHDELADVQTYLDLLAFRLGIDLGAATVDKFNRVSKRVGCDVRLE